MKRITALSLVLLMLLMLLPLGAAANDYDSSSEVTVIDGGVYVNIAVGKKYTSTGTKYAGCLLYTSDAADEL